MNITEYYFDEYRMTKSLLFKNEKFADVYNKLERKLIDYAKRISDDIPED